MDKTIRGFTSFDEMKMEEYREWQAMPGLARLSAAAELSMSLFPGKGSPGDLQQGLQRTFVRLQRPPS
jgi:hypothetical protein